MAIQDALDFYFTEALGYSRFLLDPDPIPNEIDALSSGLAGYLTQPPQPLKDSILSLATSYRSDYLTRKSLARSLLNLAMAWIMEELDSKYASGGNVTDEQGAFFDFRKRLVADGDFVNPRDVTPDATPPAAGNGLIARRLHLDHTGQVIEGGIHSDTVTGEIVASPLMGAGTGRANLELTGSDGQEDELDYRNKGTALNATVTVPLAGDSNPIVPNAAFNLTGVPADGDDVTSANLQSWIGSDVAGSPTAKFRTASPWRNKTGSIEIGGNGTTKRYEQTLILPSGSNAYIPIDSLIVLRRDADWTGTVTITIGNVTKSFTQADMTTNVFFYGHPDLNEDLYPVNFDTGSVKIRVDVATTHATGKIQLHYFDAQNMTARQGWWYSAWNHTADPVIGYAVTWTDTCDYTGSNQDTICVAYDQAPFAYLPTTGAGSAYPDV